MPTKLTLRLDEALIEHAKRIARQRGKSVSQMVAEYFAVLGELPESGEACAPVTHALRGALKGAGVSEVDYRRHLREKHL